MKLVVRNTLGETVSLQIRSDETFIGLKERVEEEAGISLDLKDIALRGKRVTEEQKVEEYFLAYANGVSGAETNIQACVVPGCRNTKLLNPDKVFFEFPTEEIRCHQWVMYCQRHYTGPGKDRLNITSESTICSDHFLPDQFVKNAHTLLKRTAIPSVKPVRLSCDEYDFISSKEKQSSSSDEDLKGNCSSKRVCRLCSDTFPSEEMLMIFNKYGDELTIADKINLCLPLKVTVTEPLPKQVCKQCNDQLNVLYKLADMCTLTQRKMETLDKGKLEKGKDKCNLTLISTGDNGKEDVLFDTSITDANSSTKSNDTNDAGNSKNTASNDCPLCVEGTMKVMNNVEFRENSVVSSSEENVVNNERSDRYNNEFEKNNSNVIFSKPVYSSDVMMFRQSSFEVNKESNETLRVINAGNLTGIISKTEPLDDGYSDLNSLISDENLYKDSLDPSEFIDPSNIKKEIDDFNTEGMHSDASELLNTFQEEIENPIEVPEPLNESFYCRVCALEYKSLTDIMLHSFGHSHKGFYQCALCVSFFTKKVDIESHLRKHEERLEGLKSSDNSVLCDICNKVFRSKAIYVAHRCLSEAELKYGGNRCPICHKSFRSESRLKFHMKFHNTKTPGYCDICDKSFPDELKLYKHSIYVHSSSKGHVCEDCGKVFKGEASMRYHQHSVHSESVFKPYTCERCGKSFIRKSMLMNHMTSSHKNIDFETSCFTCKLCNEAFPSTSSAVAHMDNQHKMECMDESTYSFDMITLKRLFVCEFCERCFAEASVLNSHRDLHPSDTPFECKICELTFASSEEVKCHRRIHKARDIPAEYLSEFLIPNTYLCEYCERCFLNYVKYKEHLTIHYGQEPYQCRHCEMKFSSLQLALQHRAQHGEISQLEESNFYRPYECHYCNKSFAIEDALVKHIRMHTGEKPFVCNQCGKGFSQSSGLYTHQKVHSSLRPYVCPLCPRTFKIKGDRDVHVRKHSGDRPYKCEFCKKAFMTQHVYSQHRKIHTGERPYKCDVCGIAFRRSHVLTVHKRIHTGEKPNICDVCGKRYRQKGDMLKHKRLQHGLVNLTNRISPVLHSSFGLPRIS